MIYTVVVNNRGNPKYPFTVHEHNCREVAILEKKNITTSYPIEGKDVKEAIEIDAEQFEGEGTQKADAIKYYKVADCLLDEKDESNH